MSSASPSPSGRDGDFSEADRRPDDPDEFVDLYVADLPESALRSYRDNHVVMVFLGGGLAVLAMLIPPTAWYMDLARWGLGLAGMALALTRLWQINGINQELERRAGEAAEGEEALS